MWLLAELCWLTPVPPVIGTGKLCQQAGPQQALCPRWIMMSENFSQVKGQPDFRRSSAHP